MRDGVCVNSMAAVVMTHGHLHHGRREIRLLDIDLLAARDLEYEYDARRHEHVWSIPMRPAPAPPPAPPEAPRGDGDLEC